MKCNATQASKHSRDGGTWHPQSDLHISLYLCLAKSKQERPATPPGDHSEIHPIAACRFCPQPRFSPECFAFQRLRPISHPGSSHGLTRFVAAVHSDTTSKFRECSDRHAGMLHRHGRKLNCSRRRGLNSCSQRAAVSELYFFPFSSDFTQLSSSPRDELISGVYCSGLLNGQQGCQWYLT
jgi:hypothetical protein